MKSMNAYTVAYLINQKGPNVADAIVKAIDDMTMEDLAEFKRYMEHGTFINIGAGSSEIRPSPGSVVLREV